jgi:hypothetical protein
MVISCSDARNHSWKFAWYTAACMIIVNIVDGGVLSLFGNSLNYVAYEMADYVSRTGRTVFRGDFDPEYALNMAASSASSFFCLSRGRPKYRVYALYLSFVAMFSASC